jgi:hypothetical protein
MLELGGLLRIVSRKGMRNPSEPLGSNRIAITRDGSGIFPLDRSRVTGCQFLGFHGVKSSNKFIFDKKIYDSANNVKRF